MPNVSNYTLLTNKQGLHKQLLSKFQAKHFTLYDIQLPTNNFANNTNEHTDTHTVI